MDVDGQGRLQQPRSDDWFCDAYDRLRFLAAAWLTRERPGHTLQATALVHEAFLTVGRGRTDRWPDRSYFLGAAARAMRQILVAYARRKATAKRGGGCHRVSMEALDAELPAPTLDLLELHEAIERLAEAHQRAARIVECRLFAGLTIDEVARLLGVSKRTAETDWRFGRAWMIRALNLGGF
ncbi:MAG: ECF-type sigma factor [Planctomycetota bacterium]